MTPNLITLAQPNAPAAEAFRTLRTNLLFSNIDAQLKTLAITSPKRHDDKSTTIANLAVTFAQSEHRVILVDADFRQPQQSAIWGLSGEKGLADMLIDPTLLDNPPLQSTSVDGLQVLATGQQAANPADLMASRRMTDVIDKLASIADIILFDTPPILEFADVSVLGQKIDGVAMVTRTGTSRRDAALRAKEQLQRVQVNIVGVVLTHTPQASGGLFRRRA